MGGNWGTRVTRPSEPGDFGRFGNTPVNRPYLRDGKNALTDVGGYSRPG